MSNIDDLAARLQEKYKTDNGRVPDLHEVLAAAYDPATQSLRISGGGGGGGGTAERIYTQGFSDTPYSVPADATVVVFLDVQTAGVVLPEPGENKKVTLVNAGSDTSGSADFDVSPTASPLTLMASKQATLYSIDVGGGTYVWAPVINGGVPGSDKPVLVSPDGSVWNVNVTDAGVIETEART